ncbi:hypothetical protein LTR64_005366 [Lithohypha guttulata]|uniref:uncharacterized protein n=1 Tax=Lithohypha guttulata TaxID=1690604 RepID=UPI00315CA4B5
MPPDVIRDAEIVTDLISAAERPLPHSGTASSRSSRTREIYPSLLEFRHLAVYIESCEPENVASFFRTTRDFVANRNVSIRNIDVNSRYVHRVSDALQWSSYWRYLAHLTTGSTTVIDMVAFAKMFFRVVTDHSGIKHNDPRYRSPCWLVELVDANMPPPAKRYNANDLSDLLWPSVRAGNKTEFCRLARIVLEKLVEVTQRQTEEAVQENINFAKFIPDSVERIVELRVKQKEAEESISSFFRDVIGDRGLPQVVEEEPLDGGDEVGK